MSQDTTAVVVRLQADHARLQRDLARAQRNLKKYQSQSSTILKGIGAQLAGAFAITTVASFGLEVVKLSGKVENVKLAFDRLADSAALLEKMKAATSGTVSELELMQQAVKANNFKISLEALPRLLEFATLRARQTGESVDYLVNSIVTGIGRKSLLILDNLGISATALKEELGGVSPAAVEIGQVAEAVGRIAERELMTMGTAADNAGMKIERLGANWENLKANIGEVSNQSSILNGVLDDLNKVLTGKLDERSTIAKLIFTGPEVKKSLTEASDGFSALYKKVKDLGGVVFTFPMIVDFFKELLQVNGKKIGDSFIGPLPKQLGFFEEALKSVEEAGKKAQKTFSRPLINPGAIGGMTDPKGGISGDPIWESYRKNVNDFLERQKFALAQAREQNKEFFIGLKMDAQRELDELNAIINATMANGIATISESLFTGGLKKLFSNLQMVLADGMSNMGKALIAMGLAENAFLKSLNPGVKIAAGAALVGLAAVFKSASASASKGASGSFGNGGGPSFQNNIAGQSINLDGEFIVRGQDLVLAINRNTALNKRI